MEEHQAMADSVCIYCLGRVLHLAEPADSKFPETRAFSNRAGRRQMEWVVADVLLRSA